ncbi:hypothetical protein Q7P37_005258 [Cladosporium fusiforme]
MTYAIFDASILPAKASLESLKHILQKAESSDNAAELLEARIHPEMLGLSFQVHMITNTSQQAVARLSGTDPKAYEDNLKTFADFYARIAEVQDIVAKADKETINSRAESIVTIGFGPGKSADLPAAGYVNGYVVPNLLFHLTTVYNIFRMKGVPLGKRDYVSPFISGYVDLSKFA